MKNTITILALSAIFFSCSSKKLTLDKASPNSPIMAINQEKTKGVSFASQLESPEIKHVAIPITPLALPDEGLAEASTAQSIAKYVPVYELTTKANNNTVVAKKLTFGQRFKLRAIKGIVGATSKQQSTNSDMAMIGTLLNKFSFWLGLISMITAIFLTGLGFTLGLLGLIFGIIGTTLPSSNKDTGMLGILFSAIGILLAIIFAAVYRNFLFND